MYQRTIFETASELFDAYNRTGPSEDGTPSMPPGVYLVFDGETPCLSGGKSELVEISANVTQSELIVEAFKRCGIRLHLT